MKNSTKQKLHRLKYRVFDNGEWYYGYPSEMRTGVIDLICLKEDDYFMIRQNIDVDKLCQNTGYRDYNGKEIYQGDILKFIHREEDNIESIVKVGFDEMFSVDYPTGDFDYLALCSIVEEYLGEVEYYVIGNIFENPELIKNAD